MPVLAVCVDCSLHRLLTLVAFPFHVLADRPVHWKLDGLETFLLFRVINIAHLLEDEPDINDTCARVLSAQKVPQYKVLYFW